LKLQFFEPLNSKIEFRLKLSNLNLIQDAEIATVHALHTPKTFHPHLSAPCPAAQLGAILLARRRSARRKTGHGKRRATDRPCHFQPQPHWRRCAAPCPLSAHLNLNSASPHNLNALKGRRHGVI
jgi:hypothetical protein